MVKRDSLVTVFRLIFCLWIVGLLSPAHALEREAGGEFFTIQMHDYFVELQGGQRVDLEITYQFPKNFPRADMPDYRAVQILVEDALYGLPQSYTYWEITNREIVRRLLTAFPLFLAVESKFFIEPREILNIRRGTTVALLQADAKGLDAITQIDQDAYYQARTGAFNILVPRPLKASVAELVAKIKASPKVGEVILDYTPFPLAGSEFTFPEIVNSLNPAGAYRALILPLETGKKAGLHLVKELGPLRGIVKVLPKDSAKIGPDAKVVAEISLADTLGLERANVDALALADAREKFYRQKAAALIVEEKYAFPYQVQKFPIEPYAAETRIGLFVPEALKEQPVPKWLLDGK